MADETIEPQATAEPATGTGTSTGTTTLTVASVTGTIVPGSIVTGTGVPANTTIVKQLTGPEGGAGTYQTSAATTLSAVALTFTPNPDLPFFPEFTPIIPTSAFPPGGGVGSIGEAVATPTFPPPTPPPIGTVPVGPLVGPAIAAAGVPPSLAGVVQPQYKTGSATTPAANGYFPLFTTTGAYAGFPNNPPTGVPIVFSNISTNPSKSGGVWTVITPPSTATTAQITLNGASNLTPHALDLRFGHQEFVERHYGTVFPGSDTAHLHQPLSTKNSRRKRLSESGAAGRANTAK